MVNGIRPNLHHSVAECNEYCDDDKDASLLGNSLEMAGKKGEQRKYDRDHEAHFEFIGMYCSRLAKKKCKGHVESEGYEENHSHRTDAGDLSR